MFIEKVYRIKRVYKRNWYLVANEKFFFCDEGVERQFTVQFIAFYFILKMGDPTNHYKAI